MDLSELWAIFGPGVAGAVFGAGWWFWVDAVVCSSVSVSFVHYLPGQSLFFLFFVFGFCLIISIVLIRVWFDSIVCCCWFRRIFCFFCGSDVQLRQERRHRLLSLRRRRVEVCNFSLSLFIICLDFVIFLLENCH